MRQAIDALACQSDLRRLVTIAPDNSQQRLAPSASRRLGLLMNLASVDNNLRFSDEVVRKCGLGVLTKLFSPQHGFWADAQANMVETEHSICSRTGLPILSLYGQTRRPTAEMLADIDLLVIDLQDVGTRVYTFAWTVAECLEACAEHGVPVLVLDRINPIGGTLVEGALLEPDFASFVGGASIPMRHGLTMGELARLIRNQRGLSVELSVLPVEGLTRDQDWTDLHREWIATSPNLARLTSLWTYPGQVLWEGTNVSEGRGTTTPFEVVGAPWIDPVDLSQSLNELTLAGVKFLPTRFRPSFDKFQGQLCGGVSIHVTQRSLFASYQTAVQMMHLIAKQYPEYFELIDPPYEYEWKKMPIDIISGGDALRASVRQTASSNDGDRSKLWRIDGETWQQTVRSAWLYRDQP